MNSSDEKSNARSTKMTTAKPASAAGAKRASSTLEDACPSPLNTGLRDRLIGRLDQAGIPAHARTAYLAALTERAAQSVSRWLDREQPGLPDLASCERLCRLLPCSDDWMLGLPQEPSKRARGRATAAMLSGPDFMHSALELLNAITRAFDDCESIRMSGDESAENSRR